MLEALLFGHFDPRRVYLRGRFVEGTKRTEMIWAAEKYHLECAIRGHDHELNRLRAQKNATEDERARVWVQEAIYEVHRGRFEKYSWIHELRLWR